MITSLRNNLRCLAIFRAFDLLIKAAVVVVLILLYLKFDKAFAADKKLPEWEKRMNRMAHYHGNGLDAMDSSTAYLMQWKQSQVNRERKEAKAGR